MDGPAQEGGLTTGDNLPPEPSVLKALEPKKLQVSEVRRELGLPEKPPRSNDESKETRRKAAVDKFCQEKLKELLWQKRGFIDQNQPSIAKSQKEEQKLTLSDRLALTRMKVMGFKDAEKVMKAISSEMGSGGYEYYAKRKIINNLTSFSLESLQTAIHRYNILGYKTLPSDLETQDSAAFLHLLADVTEEDFQKVCQELNPYVFLSHEISASYLIGENEGQLMPETLALMDILKNKGLTPVQKQILDQQLRLALLHAYGSPPVINTEGEIEMAKFRRVDLDAVFRTSPPNELMEKMTLLVEEDVLYRLENPQPLVRPECYSYDAINFLKKTNYLDKVYELTRKGVDCTLVLKYGSYGALKDPEMENLIRRSFEFFSDQDKTDWTVLFTELFNEELNLWNIDNYERLYQQREDLAKIAIFSQALPDNLNLRFDKELVTSWGGDNFDPTKILKHIWRELDSRLKNISLKGNDKLFTWAVTRMLLKQQEENPENNKYKQIDSFRTMTSDHLYVNKSFLDILVFLSQNKANISEYVTDFSIFKGRLIEEMLQGNIVVPPDEINYWLENTDFQSYPINPDIALRHIFVFKPQVFSKLLGSFSVEMITQADYLTTADKKLLLKCLEVNSVNISSFLFAYRDRFNQFFIDSRPTINFFESAAEYAGGRINVVSNLLTEECISLFPEDIQPLWRFIAPCPSSIINFAYENRDRFPDFMKNGQLTVEFFDEVCSVADRKEFLPLLTDKVIATFSLEDQAYWRFFQSVNHVEIEDFLKKYGRYLLKNQDDINFFQSLIKGDWGEMDKTSDLRFGQRLMQLPYDEQLLIFEEFRINDLAQKIFHYQFHNFIPDLEKDIEAGVNDKNWNRLLVSYIGSQSPEWFFSRKVEPFKQKLNELFMDSSVKDFCLGKFRLLWLSYLQNGRPDAFPATLTVLSEFINQCEGADPLRHINSLSNFSLRCRKNFEQPSEYHQETFLKLKSLEERFDKDRWSYEDRSKLYDILSDTLVFDPALFRAFLNTFEKITSPAQLKKFATELCPLYQAELNLLYQGESNSGFTPLKPELLCQHLLSFSESVFQAPAATQSEKIEEDKQRILDSIKQGFKSRFGIIKAPDVFTHESIRSLKNMITYMVNIHEKDPDKEQKISLYLALMLNHQWEAFRQGEVIDPAVYFEPEKASKIQEFLDRRRNLNPITAENLDLQSEELAAFQSVLQGETEHTAFGNIKTIDEKLGDVIRNIKDLEDEDAFPDKVDKQMLRLFVVNGSGRVNGVLAKSYQQLAGKTIPLSPDEQKIQEDIRRIFQENGFEWTPQGIKQIQDKTGSISMIVNINEVVIKSEAEMEIENLRKLLMPSSEIIALFNRLGEEFTPSSGVIAVSQDLGFLENLIVKRGDELSVEEKGLLNEYLDDIRSQMQKLETTFKNICDRFKKLRTGVAASSSIKKRVDEIGEIIKGQDNQQIITSKITNDMNVIIENIRACLGCLSKECNNDTNLTFGDSYKFYVTSQSSSQQQGSVADQIVFLVPITYPDGRQEISFVFDKLYGSKSSDVLVNHVAAVFKKYRELRNKFPQVKLSLFITNAALISSGVPADILIDKLKKIFDVPLSIQEPEYLDVNVPESALGDHYVEFGGETRSTGSRNVNGVIITS